MATLQSVLRLMRFGLAPTAVADAAVLYFLTHHDPWADADLVAPRPPDIDWAVLGLLALSSAGLYCFGMTQNDIVDQGRDSLTKRDRPLVTGELPLWAGWATAVGCALVGLLAAASVGQYTLLAATVTFGLINAYHLFTKTMGGLGVLNLGLIRLTNAMLFLADSQLAWPPFVLFLHIVLMTATAYHLEGKAPALGRRDGFILAGGCALVGLLLASGKAGLHWHLSNEAGPLAESLAAPPADMSVLISTLAFGLFAVHIGRLTTREDLPPAKRGGLLIKNGLLYLIVLDASFLAWNRWMGAVFVLSALAVSWALMNILRRPQVFKQ